MAEILKFYLFLKKATMTSKVQYDVITATYKSFLLLAAYSKHSGLWKIFILTKSERTVTWIVMYLDDYCFQQHEHINWFVFFFFSKMITYVCFKIYEDFIGHRSLRKSQQIF